MRQQTLADIAFHGGKLAQAYRVGGRSGVLNAFVQQGQKIIKEGKVIRGAVRGAAKELREEAAEKVAKSSFKIGYDAYKAANVAAAAKTAAKITTFGTKAAKVATGVLGIADIVGDVLVESSLDDNLLLSFLPGAGIVEIGAATINHYCGTNYLNAKPIWHH